MADKDGNLTGNLLQDLELVIAAIQVIGEFAQKYGLLDEQTEKAEDE